MLLIATLAALGGLLAFDIFSHRKPEAIPLGAAIRWSIFYVLAAMIFAGMIAATRGVEDASLFLAGYAMEKALSIDNLVVFGSIFAYFAIPDDRQHRILHYGVIGAAVARMLFVLAVGGPLYLFGRPVEAVLGLIVLWSAYKMAQGDADDEEEINHRARWYGRLIAWFFITPTPALLCLVSIEVMDIMFSFDSVPVVVSVTKDPVLIYSAMMFAVLGLRSMYFVLSALQRILPALTMSVTIVLSFVAFKLMAHAVFEVEISALVSLAVIGAIFGAGGLFSLTLPRPAQSEVKK